jgi:hypothetical protein
MERVKMRLIADRTTQTGTLFSKLADAKTPEDKFRALSESPLAAEELKSSILSSISPKPPTAPASVRLTDEIMETEQRARQADASGDTTAAQQLRDRATLLREQTKGMEIVTGYDDASRAIFRIGTKGVSGATVATQSQAQQKLVRYENTLELMNYLSNAFKPEHLGLAGVAGEWILDRTLAMKFPEMANLERVDARTALIFLREGLMREVSNDPRFSNLDREEISKALPSSGMFENVPRATQQMATAARIIRQRSKAYAHAIGQPPPLWALSSDEVLALYEQGKADPRKGIDRATALDILTRFH